MKAPDTASKAKPSGLSAIIRFILQTPVSHCRKGDFKLDFQAFQGGLGLRPRISAAFSIGGYSGLDFASEN
jgi:hypothetical protein